MNPPIARLFRLGVGLKGDNRSQKNGKPTMIPISLGDFFILACLPNPKNAGHAVMVSFVLYTDESWYNTCPRRIGVARRDMPAWARIRSGESSDLSSPSRPCSRAPCLCSPPCELRSFTLSFLFKKQDSPPDCSDTQALAISAGPADASADSIAESSIPDCVLLGFEAGGGALNGRGSY